MGTVSQTAALPDYHTHTRLCGHARGEAHEYVEAALSIGLPAIGVADHLPLLHTRDPHLSMDLSELEGYVDGVLRLKDAYPGYVLLGVEADYVPATLDRLQAMLDDYPFDYVIGSVHFIDGWGFDDPRNLAGFESRSVDDVYRRYYDLVGEAAESGMFDILGHIDLVKKFGHRPSRDMDRSLQHLAARVARANVLVEVNTAGLYRPVGEMYPAPEVLHRLARAGIMPTFGSDAHAPDEVGRAFSAARELVLDQGMRAYGALVPSHDGRRARVETRTLTEERP